MGYGIIGSRRKTDEESVIYIECQYAYQPIFKQCFEKDILEFNGRVTKAKLNEFEIGLMKFINNPNQYNLDYKMFIGNLANNTYEKLCMELSRLLDTMKDKSVQYLDIC